jgi:hypothetical protein
MKLGGDMSPYKPSLIGAMPAAGLGSITPKKIGISAIRSAQKADFETWQKISFVLCIVCG